MMTRWTLLYLILFLPASAGAVEPSALAPGEALPLPRIVPPPGGPPPIEAAPAGPACGPACAPPIKVQHLTQPHVLLVPHQQAIALPVPVLKEVEVGRIQNPVLEFQDQKQCIIVDEIKECEVSQVVTVTETKEVEVVDPCTGKCCKVYQTCPVEKVVKVKVYQTVPVKKEVVVKVPVLKPGPEQQVMKLALIPTTVPATLTTYTAVPSFQNLTAVVPPMPPPPPPPPPVCPGCPHH